MGFIEACDLCLGGVPWVCWVRTNNVFEVFVQRACVAFGVPKEGGVRVGQRWCMSPLLNCELCGTANETRECMRRFPRSWLAAGAVKKCCVYASVLANCERNAVALLMWSVAWGTVDGCTGCECMCSVVVLVGWVDIWIDVGG